MYIGLLHLNRLQAQGGGHFEPGHLFQPGLRSWVGLDSIGAPYQYSFDRTETSTYKSENLQESRKKAYTCKDHTDLVLASNQNYNCCTVLSTAKISTHLY